MIWEKYSSNSGREVVKLEAVVDGHENQGNRPVFAWSSNARPSIQDMDKYITIFDPTGKKEWKISELNSTRFVSFKLKANLVLMINKYTNLLTSKSSHTQLSKDLLNPGIRDMSNAVALERNTEIVNELKQKHGMVYRAQDIHWYVWANEILSKPAELHDSLIASPPPGHIIHFFSAVHLNADVELQRLATANQVALGENRSVGTSLVQLRSSFDNMKRRLADLFDDFDQRLAALERENCIRKNVLTDHAAAQPVQMSSASESLLARVMQQEHVDHEE